eukprot:5151271-Prorocentrum_lima.AAC.1
MRARLLYRAAKACEEVCSMREVEIDWRRKQVYLDARVLVRWDSDIDSLNWDQKAAAEASVDLPAILASYAEKNKPPP